jgi:hypothetical protein
MGRDVALTHKPLTLLHSVLVKAGWEAHGKRHEQQQQAFPVQLVEGGEGGGWRAKISDRADRQYPLAKFL